MRAPLLDILQALLDARDESDAFLDIEPGCGVGQLLNAFKGDFLRTHADKLLLPSRAVKDCCQISAARHASASIASNSLHTSPDARGREFYSRVMTFLADDIVAVSNDPELDGLSHISFGGPDGIYFMMCRPSAEAIAATGLRDLGPADIYCRYNDQGNACYQGVESCVLHPESFDIHFWPKAQKALGIECLTISLPARSPSLTALGTTLNSIFRGTGVFQWRTEATELRSTVALVGKVVEVGSRSLDPQERLKVRDFFQGAYLNEVAEELTLLLERLTAPLYMDDYATFASADTTAFLGDLRAELADEFGLHIEDWGEGATWRLPGNNAYLAVKREGGNCYVVRPLSEDHAEWSRRHHARAIYGPQLPF